MKHAMWAVAAIAVLLVAWAPRAAQTGPALVLRDDGDAWVLEPMGGTVQLSDLAAAVGDALGLRLRRPLRTVAGFGMGRAPDVVLTSLTGPRRIPHDGLREAVEGLLATVDHTLREVAWGSGGFLDMVPALGGGPMNTQLDWMLARPVDADTLSDVRSPDAPVLLTITTEHRSAGEIFGHVQPIPREAMMRGLDSNDHLLLVARARDARRILDQVRALDVPGKPRLGGDHSTIGRLTDLRAGVDALEARAETLEAH